MQWAAWNGAADARLKTWGHEGTDSELGGDWGGAAELWERELTNSNERVAGRAYYNMAISSEINGDLDKAIQFASKSYTDYRTNMALDYINVLRHRVRQNQVLNSQLAR